MGATRDPLEAVQSAHVLYTWSAQKSARGVSIRGGQGVWFEDHAGQRWLDFESQVFNCNVGHGNARIAQAIADQALSLPCAHPAAVFPSKVALGEKLAAIAPGDIDRFFLCLSGAEANENALKIARMLTGRSKVVARRRSYHGASMGALSLTGDNRRLAAEPGLWGVLRMEDPYCYRCPFGLRPESCGTLCAGQLEHILQMEGPETVAAVFVEGVTGANGGFVPPDDYWPKLREICDRYGVLLVADEVFSGFGRTGKWFAVDHWGVVPDIITMAKGISGGYAPLGAVGLRRHLAARFDEETLWAGLTNYAHPISCAAGSAAIDVYEEEGLIENAARLQPVLRAALDEVAAKHVCVGDVRAIGLFGTLEFVADRQTREPLVAYGKKAQAGSLLARLAQSLKERRIHALIRGNCLFITPPLCIDEADLRWGIAQIDEALAQVQAQMAAEGVSDESDAPGVSQKREGVVRVAQGEREGGEA